MQFNCKMACRVHVWEIPTLHAHHILSHSSPQPCRHPQHPISWLPPCSTEQQTNLRSGIMSPIHCQGLPSHLTKTFAGDNYPFYHGQRSSVCGQRQLKQFAYNNYTEWWRVGRQCTADSTGRADTSRGFSRHKYFKSDVWLTVHRNSVWIRKAN